MPAAMITTLATMLNTTRPFATFWLADGGKLSSNGSAAMFAEYWILVTAGKGETFVTVPMLVTKGVGFEMKTRFNVPLP